MKKSAGVIIILNDNKILLTHPTNSRWVASFSFPKGGIEKDETKLKAAIRELKEETSIVVNKSQITNPDEPIVINYTDRKGEIYKRLYLYTVYINDISEIGLTDEIIPVHKLQKDELDWAGFISKKDAINKIFPRVAHLLDLIN